MLILVDIEKLLSSSDMELSKRRRLSAFAFGMFGLICNNNN